MSTNLFWLLTIIRTPSTKLLHHVLAFAAFFPTGQKIIAALSSSNTNTCAAYIQPLGQNIQCLGMCGLWLLKKWCTVYQCLPCPMRAPSGTNMLVWPWLCHANLLPRRADPRGPIAWMPPSVPGSERHLGPRIRLVIVTIMRLTTKHYHGIPLYHAYYMLLSSLQVLLRSKLFFFGSGDGCFPGKHKGYDLKIHRISVR